MSFEHLPAYFHEPDWWDDFKAFVSKGSVLDLGVGLVIGSAFGSVVTSFVNDLLMPPIGLVLGTALHNYFLVLRQGRTDVDYATPEEANADGAVTLNVGAFAQNAVNFILVAFVLFWLIRLVSALRRHHEQAEAEASRECPECCSQVDMRAKRCKFCTVQLNA